MKQREIIFRAWDKKNKKMIYWNENEYNDFDYEGCNPNSMFIEMKREELVIQQFTGLKDKNEKRIFENDIVKDGFGNIREVVWENENARFHYGEYGLVERATKDYEIIGNIFENFELLK